jgi:hypothetical protein
MPRSRPYRSTQYHSPLRAFYSAYAENSAIEPEVRAPRRAEPLLQLIVPWRLSITEWLP